MSDQQQATNNSVKRKHENDDLLDDQNEKNLELDESYITMVDVLKEEEKLEEDAYAVLGGSDDKNCTYEQGYINRQALYACRTCMGPNAGEDDIFGMCLACSYACHADHDLVELYTKRAFRCDCGSSKMKNKKSCTLDPKPADSLNELNKYNHNFLGKYCLCDQPYPPQDPEAKDEEMVQCIVCEDWFHENCLGCSFPDDENYAELICKNCMSDNNFLWYYQTEKVKIKNGDSNEAVVDVLKVEDVKLEDVSKPEVVGSSETNGEESKVSNEVKPESTVEQQEIKVEPEAKPQTTVGEESKIVDQCKLKALKSKVNIEGKQGTTFWDEGWRMKLCKCEECLSLYTRNKVEFLMDETDTVHYYEAKGKEKCQKLSQYERGLSEISKMGHVAGIEPIMEYNNMSNEFKEHFKNFAEHKKVITQKDIEEFFATLKYKKRMKLDHSF